MQLRSRLCVLTSKVIFLQLCLAGLAASPAQTQYCGNIFWSNPYRYGTYGSPQSKKKHTVWEAPTREGRRVKSQVETAQVNYVLESPQVAGVLWLDAKRYYDARDYANARKLLTQISEMDVGVRKYLPHIDVAQMRADCISKMTSQNPNDFSQYGFGSRNSYPWRRGNSCANFSGPLAGRGYGPSSFYPFHSHIYYGRAASIQVSHQYTGAPGKAAANMVYGSGAACGASAPNRQGLIQAGQAGGAGELDKLDRRYHVYR